MQFLFGSSINKNIHKKLASPKTPICHQKEHKAKPRKKRSVGFHFHLRRKTLPFFFFRDEDGLNKLRKTGIVLVDKTNSESSVRVFLATGDDGARTLKVWASIGVKGVDFSLPRAQRLSQVPPIPSVPEIPLE